MTNQLNICYNKRDQKYHRARSSQANGGYFTGRRKKILFPQYHCLVCTSLRIHCIEVRLNASSASSECWQNGHEILKVPIYFPPLFCFFLQQSIDSEEIKKARFFKTAATRHSQSPPPNGCRNVPICGFLNAYGTPEQPACVVVFWKLRVFCWPNQPFRLLNQLIHFSGSTRMNNLSHCWAIFKFYFTSYWNFLLARLIR